MRRRLPPRPGAFLPSRFFSTGRALLADVMRRGRFADAGGLLSFRPSTSYRLRTTAQWGRYFYPIGVPGLGGATAERLVSRALPSTNYVVCTFGPATIDRGGVRSVDAREAGRSHWKSTFSMADRVSAWRVPRSASDHARAASEWLGTCVVLIQSALRNTKVGGSGRLFAPALKVSRVR